jgi:hypothetical protein
MRKLSMLLVAAAAVLGACGDDGDASGAADNGMAADDGRACELLSAEEVEEALGDPVRDVRADRSIEGRERCSWFLDSEPVGTLHVIAYDEDSGRRLFEGELGRQVEGLGDEARWSGQLSTMYVQVEGFGAAMVQLVVDPPPENARRVARDLATLVVDRLTGAPTGS